MKEKGKNFTGLQTFWSDIAVIMVLSFVLIIAFLATVQKLAWKGNVILFAVFLEKSKHFFASIAIR